MLTNFLSYINSSDRRVGQTPGVVYMVGASFEFSGTNYLCEGPILSHWLTMYLAQKGFILVTDGKAGFGPDDFTSRIDTEVAGRASVPITDKIDACIIALTGFVLTDTSFTNLNKLVALVPKLKTISDTVIALDYPPIEDRNIPFLLETLGVNQNWWDNTWRPQYRTAMQNAGAVIINAHYDWEPNNLMGHPGLPPGVPDWHITSVSARRAAKRIFNYLMSNTSLSTK